MRAPIYPTATEALDKLLAAYDNEPLRVAETLGINNAHVYIYRKHRRITPKLRRQLENYRYIPEPPKRHRLHYEAGRGDVGADQRATLQAEMEAAGCDSFTEYVDWLRSEVHKGDE